MVERLYVGGFGQSTEHFQRGISELKTKKIKLNKRIQENARWFRCVLLFSVVQC